MPKRLMSFKIYLGDTHIFSQKMLILLLTTEYVVYTIYIMYTIKFKNHFDNLYFHCKEKKLEIL